MLNVSSFVEFNQVSDIAITDKDPGIECKRLFIDLKFLFRLRQFMCKIFNKYFFLLKLKKVQVAGFISVDKVKEIFIWIET